MSKEQIVVAYWSIRGLCAPLRMAVLYANHPVKFVNYDVKPKEGGGWDISEWSTEKPALKMKNPLMNLPYIIHGDRIISQTNACLTYLGRKLNMLGNNEIELEYCEQLLCEVMDLRNAVIKFVYNPKSDAQSAKVELDNYASSSGYLQKFELWLERNVTDFGNSGIFLVGDSATVCDFHLWEMLDECLAIFQYYKLENNPLASFPRLNFFHSSFKALSGNKRYFESKQWNLPFNQKMAAFGAVPSFGAWVNGQSWDWENSNETL